MYTYEVVNMRFLDDVHSVRIYRLCLVSSFICSWGRNYIKRKITLLNHCNLCVRDVYTISITTITEISFYFNHFYLSLAIREKKWPTSLFRCDYSIINLVVDFYPPSSDLQILPLKVLLPNRSCFRTPSSNVQTVVNPSWSFSR